MPRLPSFLVGFLAVSLACEPPPRRGAQTVTDTQSMAAESAAAGVPTTAPAGPVPRQALSATSTVATLPDSAGLPRLLIVNHRYLVHRGPGEQRAVLEERTERFCCLGGERDDTATITLRRHGPPDAGATRWEATLRADDGAFWREFYRAARRAAGDGTDALQFVHMGTGQTVFSHSRESGADGDALPSVHHWGSSTNRYVAFHDRHTPLDPPEAGRDSALVGVLQYGPPAGPVVRILVRRTRGRAAEGRLQRLEFGHAEWRGRDLEVPAGSARSAADAMTGFSIRLVFATPGDDSLRVVDVPVVRDRPRLDQATLPPGFVVRAAP